MVVGCVLMRVGVKVDVMMMVMMTKTMLLEQKWTRQKMVTFLMSAYQYYDNVAND